MDEIFKLQKILDFFNYVCWFFLLNLFFMILNIPLIVFFLFVGINNITTYLPLFLVCIIPLGPSITALFYCMGKLIRNKDLDIFSDFIYGLKINFKQSLIIWCAQLFFIFIISCNIKFFSTIRYNLIISCLSVSLLIINLLLIPYLYILISRFSMKIIDVIKSAIILTITRPVITIGNIAISLFVLMLFELSAGTTVLFIASVFAFLIMFSNKGLINQLENSYSK